MTELAQAGRGRWRRRLLDVVLLPFALIVVLLEDVIWAGIQIALRRVENLGPVIALRRLLGRLPGWAALPLFLVPEAFGRIGEVWAVALLVHRHAISATLVYVSVRLVATVMAVFIYHACEPALLRVRWFAMAVGWVGQVREWALARLAPLRAAIRRAPRVLSRRFAAMRRWVAARTVRRF